MLQFTNHFKGWSRLQQLEKANLAKITFHIRNKVLSHEKHTPSSVLPIKILTGVLEVNLVKTYEKKTPMFLVDSVAVWTVCVRLHLYKTAVCVCPCVIHSVTAAPVSRVHGGNGGAGRNSCKHRKQLKYRKQLRIPETAYNTGNRSRPS